ncbi:metalloproteinase inhibitor 2 [Sinocyclocheilus rhinocerous]|uniref:Metalloproteinase inhibitor 4 n=1 Tax=Sinocyclocheilus rhinocerous TaxID=307959 RepID=A0A673KWZ6_9TELE|nr:PREDICTED: metalloproteinase inhibitor 4 [Sinocyclocheilus rhinocerous]
MSAAVTLGLLFFLSAGLNEQVAEGCSCAPGHPQQLFCMSDIVMRAEVTGEKIIYSDEYTPGMGKIQYEIQVIKVFKGFDRIKEIQHVYTNEMSSMCGTRLGRGQYLLSGSIASEGFFVSMCDYLALWDRLSLMQKKNIKHRYLMSCSCMISTCTEKPCQPSTKNECILTNLSSLWSFEDREPIHESACIRHSDGSCGWYGGTGKPSENDTMDVSDV